MQNKGWSTAAGCPASAAVVLGMVAVFFWAAPSMTAAWGIGKLLGTAASVELRNELQRPVLYKSSINGNETLSVLGAAEVAKWRVRGFLAPIHWCYLFMDNTTQGFFWIYRPVLRCTNCYYRIVEENDRGPQFSADGMQWHNVTIYTTKPQFSNFNLSKEAVTETVSSSKA